MAPDGATLYALHSTIGSPPRVVRLDAVTADQEPAFLRAPGDLDSLPSTLTEVHVEADDGSPLRAWLVLPEGVSGRAPSAADHRSAWWTTYQVSAARSGTSVVSWPRRDALLAEHLGPGNGRPAPTSAAATAPLRGTSTTTDGCNALPDAAYAAITCRPVYRWTDVVRLRHRGALRRDATHSALPPSLAGAGLLDHPGLSRCAPLVGRAGPVVRFRPRDWK